jgi:hypothetical protein
MKSIRQIREQYDLITEKEEAEGRKLTALVRAGLFDAKKLPALKKAMEKGVDKMSAAEKRMLINLLDSLMSQVLSNQPVYQKVKQNVQKMDEAKVEYLSKLDPRFDKKYSEKDIPTVLILKRKAVRVYPDFQKVALYYAQAIDKYVSIPFGEINVGGLNEATSPTGNTSSSRSSTGTVVLPSSGRRVALGRRRPLISAQRNQFRNAPAINRWAYTAGRKTRKAIVRSLNEQRKLDENLIKIITAAGSRIAGPALKYGDDALKTAKQKGSEFLKRWRQSRADKAKEATRKKRTRETKDLTKQRRGKTDKPSTAAGAGAAAGTAAGSMAGGGGTNTTGREWRRPAEQGYQFGLRPTTSSSFTQKNPTTDAQAQRDYQAQKKANLSMAQQYESVYVQLKNMVESETPLIDISFGDNPITINNTVAKKIVSLHESVNKTNKKKMEKMLDESASSFNKVLTFALRY